MDVVSPRLLQIDFIAKNQLLSAKELTRGWIFINEVSTFKFSPLKVIQIISATGFTSVDNDFCMFIDDKI